MDLVVGCPVYSRNWILPTWANRVKKEAAGHNLSFVFVVGRSDKETLDCIFDVCDGYPIWIETNAERQLDKQHSWVPEDFFRMTHLRNEMLARVRKLEPDAFLSLDSDMLLEPGSLDALISGLSEGYDGVGVVTSMVRRIWFESWMYYNEHTDMFERHHDLEDFEGVKEVDAIMGGKLMNVHGYQTDYRWDAQGEDLGWSRNMRGQLNRMCVVSGAKVKHVMHPEDLPPA